jgi:1,4-dihydroxy-2-naphthoate octaprenyltransferase
LEVIMSQLNPSSGQVARSLPQRPQEERLIGNVVLYFAGLAVLGFGLAGQHILFVVLGAAAALAAGAYVGGNIGRRAGQPGLGRVLGALLGIAGWLITAVLVMAQRA